MISLIDIVIKFMTGYQQSETREVILDLKKRMINYINDNFVYDIISAIPIHLFVIPLKKQLFEASMLFLKIFRTHCLFRYLNTVLNQLNFDFQTQNIIKLVLQYLLYIQWLTGIYYQVTEIVHVILLKFSVKNWIIQNHMHNKTPAIMRYLTSLYYTTSFLTTSGTGQYVPDCPPDMFIMGCLMIFSIYLVLRLMIWVYTFTLYNSSLKIQYNSIFAELQHFMDRKFLTLKLRKKIYKFINYKWEGIYCVEGKIFNSLSNNLQLQIILCGCEKLLHKSQLFGKFPRSLVLELAKHLQLEIYLNEDVSLLEYYLCFIQFYYFNFTMYLFIFLNRF